MRFSNELITFANGNTDFLEAFQDYYFNESARTAEKSEKIHNAFFAEIEKRSGVVRNADNANAWATNPQVVWGAMSVIDAVVNSVLPQTLNTSIGIFTDLRTVGYGDVVKFRVKPRTLFTVSKGGHGERTTFRQKKFDGDVVIAPIEHIVTVYTDFYTVMAGKEDIADFVRRVVLSVETEMGKDAALALTTGLSAASYPAAFKKQGAFDAKTLINLVETVQAYNYGVKPVILGTMSALSNVTPDSSLGFRGNWDASNGNIQVVKNFYGADLMILPQFAASTTPSATLALPDDTLYVVSPAMDKLVKGVLSNALTNTNQHFDNADLTQNFTYRKDWDFEFVGAAWGGTYKITG